MDQSFEIGGGVCFRERALKEEKKYGDSKDAS